MILSADGICERFHKTVRDESYHVTFRKKIYETIEESQRDLGEWLDDYNNRRGNQGKRCEGRAPYATLDAGRAIVREKVIAA